MCGRVKQLSWDEVKSVVEQLERGGALSSDPGWQTTLFDRADARPKSVVAPVHDRMPLVLSPDGAQRWLSGDIRTLVEPSRVPLVRVPASELSQPSLF